MVANNLIALDVGEKRVGVARASALARVAEPYTTLNNDNTIYQQIDHLITELAANRLVIGLPKNMNNEDTAQTHFVRKFTDELKNNIKTVTTEFQDEASSSQKAEAELLLHKKSYAKTDIDALAATYILQDYLDQHAGSAF